MYAMHAFSSLPITTESAGEEESHQSFRTMLKLPKPSNYMEPNSQVASMEVVSMVEDTLVRDNTEEERMKNNLEMQGQNALDWQGDQMVLA